MVRKLEPKRVIVPAVAVTIFIAGDYEHAVQICEQFCNEVPSCVTVRRELYVFTGGREEGIAVGLINYGRIPWGRERILSTAHDLAERLRSGMGQQSYTVQDDRNSYWVSYRPGDVQQ